MLDNTLFVFVIFLAGFLGGIITLDGYNKHQNNTISEQEYKEYSLQYLEDIRNSMLP